MRNPESTKNTSTPKKPPPIHETPPWNSSTSTMPSARTPSRPGMVLTGGSGWCCPRGASMTSGGLAVTARSYRWHPSGHRALSARRTWRATA